MDVQSALRQQLTEGGQAEFGTLDVDVLQPLADEQGLTFYRVDCDRAKTCSAVLRAVVRAVDYPEFFGSNLDALIDCLSVTVGDQRVGAVVVLRNLHEDEPSLAPHVQPILDAFAEAASQLRDQGRILVFGRATGPEIEDDSDD